MLLIHRRRPSLKVILRKGTRITEKNGLRKNEAGLEQNENSET